MGGEAGRRCGTNELWIENYHAPPHHDDGDDDDDAPANDDADYGNFDDDDNCAYADQFFWFYPGVGVP